MEGDDLCIDLEVSTFELYMMMKHSQMFWTNSLSEYQFSQGQIEFFNIYPKELLCVYTAKDSNKF